jgi:nicotinate-nucleotide adenylyltransferase
LLLLGGTFDPVHFGHLRPAEEVRVALGAERVVLVPCGDPPHREAPETPADHRLAMARAAAEGRPTVEVLDWEVRSEGPSYTVRTLEWLRERLGRRPIVTIIGSDAFTQLHHWHQWERLIDLTHVAAVRRPGTALAELESPLAEALDGRWRDTPADIHAEPGGRVMAFDVTRLDISATAIRELVAAGRSPRFLLPRSVEEYLTTHDLYRDQP